MAQELSGKVAVVTGGASGIGRASVLRFVEEGARVVVADVDSEPGEALVAELGADAAFQQTDVADARQVQRLVDFAVERFGGLHVMFNNAGVPGGRGAFLDDDFADFERVVAVNLLGVMLGSQRAARHMAKHGGGSILNTASIAALRPGGGVMSYRVSKAGVVLFTQSAAVDLGPHGIRVNCIAPGLIETPMTNYDMEPVIRRMQPLDRKGTAADVANAAVYLASDRSAQVTGQVIAVDGGTSVGAPARPTGGGAKKGSAAER